MRPTGADLVGPVRLDYGAPGNVQPATAVGSSDDDTRFPPWLD